MAYSGESRRIFERGMSGREFNEYPSSEGDNPGNRRLPFSPIKEADETSTTPEITTGSPYHYDRKTMSANNRDHQSSPKQPHHPQSPSSSSSGHSSPRSPPSHPLPHSPATIPKQPPPQQRPPHPHTSHSFRTKSHDILQGYHADPNKAGSNWKSSPSMSRGHRRASSDPKNMGIMMNTNDRGHQFVPGSPHISHHRHLVEASIGDHTPPRHHHSSRFSPEGIQAETGERGGGRGDAKSSPKISGAMGGGGGGGRSNLANVSYDSGPGSVGVASIGSEGRDGKDAIPPNHVAQRVAQFSHHSEEKEEERRGGGGGSGGGGMKATVANMRSPEFEKAKIATISPSSSEEELRSIHSEGHTEQGTEVIDGGGAYYKGGGVVSPGESFDPHAHPQLSQPAYLNRAPPAAVGLPHNPSSFPSLSQPHHSYETVGHVRNDVPLSRSNPSSYSSTSSSSSHTHQKHHPPPPHYHRTNPQPPPPPPAHEYYQMSHDHHMTGYSASHDHHASPHHRGYRQSGHTHQRVAISKQNLLKAHEAAATGNLNLLHHMLSSREVDALCMDDTGLTLVHSAAMTNNISVIVLLVNEGGLPLQHLQLQDENLISPAMVAIQNKCLDVLKWLVEEGKVPLMVQDAGGETLLHHAAHHDSVNCLQWLIKILAKSHKTDELVELVDNFGVTPAHFAAQQGHLECLQLMIDNNYSVTTADKEGQKPIDWADAMNQTLCFKYLFIHETCWGLSDELSHLTKQVDSLQRENTALKEKLASREQEYQQALGKMQINHQEKISKMREQYVDLTASLLKVKDRDSSSGGGGGGGGVGGGAVGGASPKIKSQPATRKDSRRGKPPIAPESIKKREGGGEGVDGGGGGGGGGLGFYRTATPQEVLEKQKNSLTLRMNASRKAREGRDTLVSRAFSPIQYRLNTRQEGKTALKSLKDPNKPQLKVKFSEVNQYISDHSRHGNGSHANEHSNQEGTGRKGQSPSHKTTGHPSPSHSGHASLGHTSYSGRHDEDTRDQ